MDCTTRLRAIARRPATTLLAPLLAATAGAALAGPACVVSTDGTTDSASVNPTGIASQPTTPTQTTSPGSLTKPTEGTTRPTSRDDTQTTAVIECTGDSDCPPGQKCSFAAGVCLDQDACIYDQDCEGGKVCEDGTCVIGGDCGAQEFALTSLPPNLMIVLDRSGSMDGDVDGTNDNRWTVAKSAIAQVTNTFNSDIRFGLVTFSACIPGQECSAGEIIHPPQDNNAAKINEFLSDKGFFYLCNSGKPETSTGNTLAALIGYPLLQDPVRTNAVLLLTDGNENSECKNITNGAQAAGDLYGQQYPVRTYALGFSDGVIGSLADIAAAGGTEQPYNATNPTELNEALSAIASSVASCDFQLGEAPPDGEDIYVFFNDNPVAIPNDPINGWTYDENTMTLHFHGDACAMIQDGLVEDIDVVFGCNLPVPG